jgi:hypothetical protein
MANISQKSYYQGVWQRELSLFTHYSTVRMTILAFLIPLGGLMIIQNKLWAGTLVIVMAYSMNLYFGVVKALKRWLVHKNIDLWYEIGDPDKTYDQYRQNFPGYSWFLCGAFSEYKFKKPEGVANWEEMWKKVLSRARETELFLQITVVIGIVIFYAMLVLAA